MKIDVFVEVNGSNTHLPLGDKYRYKSKVTGEELCLTGFSAETTQDCPLLFGQNYFGEPVSVPLDRILEEFEVFQIVEPQSHYWFSHKTSSSTSKPTYYRSH